MTNPNDGAVRVDEESRAELLVQLVKSVREIPDISGRTAAIGNLHELLKAVDCKQAQDESVKLNKAVLDSKAETHQGTSIGLKNHPFNMIAVRDYSDFNPYHSSCIEAKKNATVGLGFKSERVAEVLDPLCEHGLSDLLYALEEDYWETGNAYMEVVRDENEVITGLHHLPAADVYLYIEDTTDLSKKHYEIYGTEETIIRARRFARFGDREEYIKRNHIQPEEAKTVSEVIHRRMPSSHTRWYGRPEYFSAIPSIELVQAMTQHEFNYFFNNGVPEYLLFLIGQKLDPITWGQITAMLQANQGLKNSRKSNAVNIGGVDPKNFTVQVEKLAAGNDSSNSPFSTNSEITSTCVVTAHGVPPVLAGLLIPARLSGNNEGPNALLMFQVMKIGPTQKSYSQLLAGTLAADGVEFATPDGSTETLTREDFIGKNKESDKGNGFNSIIDEINLPLASTMSQMREPVAGAAGAGGARDLSQGLLTSGQDRNKTGGTPQKGTGKTAASGRGLGAPKKKA